MSYSELHRIGEELQDFLNTAQSAAMTDPIVAIETSANDVGRAWSGSWIGYHARVYYRGLKRPAAR